MSHGSKGLWPPLGMKGYSASGLSEALSVLHAQNSGTMFSVGTMSLPSPLASNIAYRGAVVAPSLGRVYLVPCGQATNPTWHYMDLQSGKVTGYTHGASGVLANAYTLGAYHSGLNRLYMAPDLQSSSAVRHYLDGASGSVVQYDGADTSPSLGYVCDPDTGYMYSAPTSGKSTVPVMSPSGSWSLAALPQQSGYVYYGGAYSETKRRIYFAPYGNSSSLLYVDCQTGTYKSLSVGATSIVSAGAYEGAVYSPVQDRIYFVPAKQAAATTWHYIDCRTGNLVAYLHGATGMPAWAYCGGVYSPATNRIYLAPNGNVVSATWHYIDCNDGKVVPYQHGTATSSLYSYAHGFYHPSQGRVYFCPRPEAGAAAWHYIQEYCPTTVPTHWPAYPIAGPN